MLVKVVYVEHGGTEHAVEVAPGDSLMHGAVCNRVPGIVAHCGGAGGCATCEVYVEQDWVDLTGRPSSSERRTLRFAFEPKANSRLACQIVMTEALDGLTVRMPPRQF
ncbi:2Fe-2S iron-sulfur cluster-binding protein [Sphingomonas oligophenolica]|uniref:2Fe-2S iron-sulfur cluster-binding protein n=1 Tax=Sphingomonas oligophenolica TaxID=301154 RepID=A0ABU9YCT0_9SPHN